MEKSPAVVNVPWLDLHPWYKQEVFLLCFESYAELHHTCRKALISEPSLLSPHTHHVVTSRSRNRTWLLPQKPPLGTFPLLPQRVIMVLTSTSRISLPVSDFHKGDCMGSPFGTWLLLYNIIFGGSSSHLGGGRLNHWAFAGHKGCTCTVEWVGRGAGLGVRGSDFLSGLCHSSVL